MRLILSLIVIFTGIQVGMYAIDTVTNIQNKRMDQLCKVDPSICIKP